MIQSFRDRYTAAVFAGRYVKRLPTDIQRRARAKMLLIDAALSIGDLRSPPGNRLEILEDDRKGQHSIRINDQWRICFEWKADGAHEVESVDYH